MRSPATPRTDRKREPRRGPKDAISGWALIEETPPWCSSLTPGIHAAHKSSSLRSPALPEARGRSFTFIDNHKNDTVTCVMGMRPENITVLQEGMETWRHIFPLEGRVGGMEPIGPGNLVYVAVNGTEFVCRSCPDDVRGTGAMMKPAFATTKPLFFAPATEQHIDI